MSGYSTLTPRTMTMPRPLRDALKSEDWGRAVDAALAWGARGRGALPPTMRAGFDAVREAFAHYEAGRDPAALTALGIIGLNSPFVEWKLLLRGLIAYTAGDDGRALDNWSRLTSQRVPAALAAPLRASIDASFRAAQSPAKQLSLRTAADKLRGGMRGIFRVIQTNLGRPERLPSALADVAAILQRVRREAPALVPILARACYAAALNGHSEGARLIRPLFDPPEDDPTLDRLQALAAERRGEWREANRFWRRYDGILERHANYADVDRRRARALIWCRCAENAARAASESRRPQLKTEIETYYRRALEVDPGLRDAYVGLFELYRALDRNDAAMAVGRRLAEIDPRDAAITAELAQMARRAGAWDNAVEWFARARTLAPFDRSLSEAANGAWRARARERALAGDLSGAESDLRAADTDAPSLALVCQWAALAYCLGDADRAAKLADQAAGINPAGAALALVAELTRLKLPRAIRAPFDAALRASFAGAADLASAIALAEIVHDQAECASSYHGQSAQLTKARRYVARSLTIMGSTNDAERLCAALEKLRWTKLLREIARTSAAEFPKDPAFPLYEALGLLMERGEGGSWRVRELLDRAHKLTEALPPGDSRARDLLARIVSTERCHAGPALNLADLIEMIDG